MDFAVLPGDNADDGTPAQFALVRDAVGRLKMPLHMLPGDHDFKPNTLDAFHDILGAPRLPTAQSNGRYRCLFLDVVSAGAGGPDLRLDDAQLLWVEQQLDHDSVERPGPAWQPPPRHADGGDADRIDAWPERGILGSQLGPNRNGRQW